MSQITITALHLSGFEVAVQGLSFEEIESTMALLVERGYRPSAAGDGWQRTPEGLPLCPKHGAVMRERVKQGDTWHSHAVVTTSGEELYCRGYPGPNSPGWLLP